MDKFDEFLKELDRKDEEIRNEAKKAYELIIIDGAKGLDKEKLDEMCQELRNLFDKQNGMTIMTGEPDRGGV